MVERMGSLPSSGEICRQVEYLLAVLQRINTLHADRTLEVDKAEGLRLVLTDWRWKLRIMPAESVIYGGWRVVGWRADAGENQRVTGTDQWRRTERAVL